jgi:hypothetical protein
MEGSDERDVLALLKCIGEFIHYVDCDDNEECKELQDKAKECLADLTDRLEKLVEQYYEIIDTISGHRICLVSRPQIPEG